MKSSFLLPFLAVLVSFLWPVHAWSQDTVFKRDNTEVLAIVEEISDSTVTYRRFDNPLGPKYVVSINRIEKIIYENGSVEEFPEPTPETSVAEVVEMDSQKEVVSVADFPQVVQHYEPAAVPDAPPQDSDKAKEKKKSGGGFSAGVLAVTETVALKDLGLDSQLIPTIQIYMDVYFTPWFFLGGEVTYGEGKIRGFDVTPYPYVTKTSANVHLGFQLPFAKSNVFGLSVYGGPSVNFLNKSSNTFFNDPALGTCFGVRLKGVVCVSVEYNKNNAVANNGLTDYWAVGLGIGF